MAVKIYSDVTKKFYDDEAAALAAEKKLTEERDAKTARRKEAAKKVEDARKALVEARKAYQDELTNFCKSFGAYHTTVSKDDVDSLIDDFWFGLFW